MVNKVKKPVKIQSRHEENVDFAFKRFGIGIFTHINFMYLFWYLELGRLISNTLQYLTIGDSKWGHIDYLLVRNVWALSDKNPTLDYIGAYCIALGITHPKPVIYVVKKIKIFEFDIKHNLLDPQTLIYCFFITFLTNEIVNLILNSVFIIYDMKPLSMVIS